MAVVVVRCGGTRRYTGEGNGPPRFSDKGVTLGAGADPGQG